MIPQQNLKRISRSPTPSRRKSFRRTTSGNSLQEFSAEDEALPSSSQDQLSSSESLYTNNHMEAVGDANQSKDCECTALAGLQENHALDNLQQPLITSASISIDIPDGTRAGVESMMVEQYPNQSDSRPIVIGANLVKQPENHSQAQASPSAHTEYSMQVEAVTNMRAPASHEELQMMNTPIRTRAQQRAAAQATRRRNESEAKRLERLCANAERQRTRRANLAEQLSRDRNNSQGTSPQQTSSGSAANESTHEEANAADNPRARRAQRRAAAEAARRQTKTEPHRLERLRANAERARSWRARANTVGASNHYHDNPQVQHPSTLGIATTMATTSENYLGSLCVTCDFCGALFFQGEGKRVNGRFNLCCNFGNISLDLFADFPDIIRSLLCGNDRSSKNFRQHIRSYNSALAMASMGAQVDSPRGGGPYCFRIHGQVYHFVGPLVPEHGTRPQYGQLYILDTDHAADERLGNPANEGCDPSIMRDLTTWFHAHDEYAVSFKMMGDNVAAEEKTASIERRPPPKIRMVFDSGRNLDHRRYNIPASSEVAVVFVGEDNDVPASRSLAVHHKEGGLQPIQDIDGCCDPLTYPLLFPRGGLGWHVNLTKNESPRIRKRITQREFYSYLLCMRASFNPLHYASKLLQQFVVDAYVKIEQNRLNYARTHQKELRIDSYQGLMDHLASDDAHEPAGQRVILPATFQGGPRAMHQSYQDAMSIVARYGKPDYFLTFTCNPRWKEISEN